LAISEVRRTAELKRYIEEVEQKNTELIQTEKTLRASEEQLADILRYAETVAFVTTDNHPEHPCIVDFSPGAEQIFGYSREEALGKRVELLHTEEDVKQLPRALRNMTSGSAWSPGETVLVRKNGEHFPALFKAHPIYDDSGEISGTIGVSIDITERKQTEQLIRARLSLMEFAQNHSLEELMQQALDEAEALSGSSVSYYHILEKDQQTVSLQAWSSRTREEFCRAEGEGLHYPIDQAGVWAECVQERRPVIHNDISSLSDRKEFPEGHTQVMRELVVPVLRGGDVAAVLGVGSKNSEYTDADKEVVSNLADMSWGIIEHMRAEQEVEEMQAQLVQMQKMETVGRLAGGIAHDFNNMLGVIIGHVEMGLEQADQGRTVKDNLLEIRKAAERSAELTGQLLAFARKQTVSPQVLDINETVEDLLKMIQRLIGEDVDLIWRPGRDTWTIHIDPSQVHQILVNLCVNAREAVRGGGTITIETRNANLDAAYCAHHEQLIPGDYVLLSVSDDGCGINANIMPHLFEPYFTTREKGKGSGMGLATVHGIVKQNRGCINVYSEQGLGTTMNIYFPRYSGKMAQRTDEVPTKEAERGSGTVLLVDDESAILNVTMKLLERLGYTVLAAETPTEAVSIAEQSTGPIHVLITDVVMPEMNGRDLAEKVASRHPGIKLLFMSGYTDNVIAHQGILEHGLNFIQKPFTIRALSEKMREVLDA